MNYPKEVWDFIAEHQTEDTSRLALKLSKTDLPKAFILNQVLGRQKAKKKFPQLANAKGFIFPAKRAIEQSSSELTAEFKAKLLSGNTLADLSGGMGMDTLAFAKRFKQVYYVEPNETLNEISRHNFEILGANNIDSHCQLAADFLKEHHQKVDAIYLDPDRRADNKRLVEIEDCSPNLKTLLPKLLEHADTILVKYSPLLDIQKALKTLSYVAKVYIVSVKNDCKELLFQIEKDFEGAAEFHAVNLESGQEGFVFTENSFPVSYSEPLTYLYEPNASVMKSNGFAALSKHYDLFKLAPNTHLFTANELKKGFPGRVLRIEKVGKASKDFCSYANVVSRNFPLKPEEIRKKYKIKEGVDFCYACTLNDKRKVFILGQLVSSEQPTSA